MILVLMDSVYIIILPCNFRGSLCMFEKFLKLFYTEMGSLQYKHTH